LHQVSGRLDQLVVLLAQAADLVLKLVALGRIAVGLDQLDARMAGHVISDLLKIRLQSAKANDAHGWLASSGPALRVSKGGGTADSASSAMAKFKPSLTRLSWVQVLMPIK